VRECLQIGCQAEKPGISRDLGSAAAAVLQQFPASGCELQCLAAKTNIGFGHCQTRAILIETRVMRKLGKAGWLIRQQGPLLALVAVMFVLFFFQAVLGDGWYRDWMAVPGDIVLSWENLRTGTGTAADLRELSTLLSCAFLHGGIDHLLNNMLFLWIFGALVAELLGQRWMLGIFLATAIGASLTHTMMNRNEFIPMLGASGAVMGFEGAYLGLAVRWRLPNPHIWPMARPIPPAHLALLAVIGVSFDYAAVMQGVDAGIAYGAHIGGFTTGLLIAALAAPPPRGRIVGRA